MSLRSLNADAPAFVPGGGAPIPPAAHIPPAVHIPPAPVAPWLSYKVGVQASRVARRTPAPVEVYPVQNLWISGQMAPALRNRNEYDFEHFWTSFFKHKTNSFDSTPLPAGAKVFNPLSGAGRHAGTVLFTKGLINFGTTDDVFRELSVCDGILLQVKETLVCPFVHPENVHAAAADLMGHYLTEERKANILALGSTSIEIPSREEDGPGGCAYYHYLFILQPSSRGSPVFPDRRFYAGGTFIRGLLSYVLADHLPLAAHIRLISADEEEAASVRQEQELIKAALSGPAGRVLTCVVEYNAYAIGDTLSSLHECMGLVRNCVQSCSIEGAPWPVSLALKMVIINSTPTPTTAAPPQDILSIFDVVQELGAMLSAYCGGIVSFSFSNSIENSNGLNHFMPQALIGSLRPEVIVSDCGPNAFEGRPFVALSTRSALRAPISALPSPYGAGAFTHPIGSVALYRQVRDIFSAVWPAYQAVLNATEMLSLQKCQAAIKHLTGTDYLIRRSGLGTPVLIAMFEGASFIMDVQTSSVSALRSSCWTCEVPDMPFVLIARVCPSVRGSRQYRIIIEDVLPYEATNESFDQRWSVVDFIPTEAQEPMCNHDAGALILRAAYVPLSESSKLIDTTGAIASTYENRQYADNQESKGFTSKRLLLSDHAALGLTMMPLFVPPGPSAAIYSWEPQEASVARFAVTDIIPAEKCDAMDDVQSGHYAVFLGVREDATPASVASSPLIAPSTPDLLPKAMCAQTQPGKALVLNEPRAQMKLDQCWVAGQMGQCARDTQRLSITPFGGEFVLVAKSQAKLLRVGMVVECLLRSSPNRGRYWDLLKAIPAFTQEGDVVVNPQLGVPTSRSEVAWRAQFPLLRSSEMQWMLQAQRYRCGRCGKVDDSGKVDPKDGQYRCKQCWSDGGYGDCVHCDKRCTSGGTDIRSGYFYCEGCWQSFAATAQLAQPGAVPPPPNSSLEVQVQTRVACNLIDAVAAKFPLHDVLDLGVASAAFLRKWIAAEIPRFVGVATSSAAYGECEEAVAAARAAGRSVELELLSPSQAEAIRTAPYLVSEELWAEVRAAHPTQFSAITCFNRLHTCFESLDTARQFFRNVSRALTPGGMFFGTFYCMNPYYTKGGSERNTYFAISWDSKEGGSQLPSLVCSPKCPDDSGSSADAATLPAPSASAWKPRLKRIVSEASSDSSPSLVDSVLPRLGMRYALTFFDKDPNYRGLATPTTPSQMSPFTPSNRGMTPSPSFTNSEDMAGSFRENVRKEFVIPLDALVVVADECGLELMHDYWGKASVALENDKLWNRTLSSDERDFMTTLKLFAFRKKFQRGGAASAPPIAPLI